jgi:hypothetical protein
MDLSTEAPTVRKVVPTTPQVKASHVLEDADPVPPTPFKPKIKETKLALNDETSDFTIICEGQRLITHKSILEASSPYFARMFRFNGNVSIINHTDIYAVLNHCRKLTTKKCKSLTSTSPP